MARLLPLTRQQRLQASARRRLGIRTASGAQVDKTTEIQYRRALLNFLAALQQDIENTLVLELQRKEFEYTRDSFVDDFANSLDALKARWLLGNEQALGLANQVVGRINKATKQRIEKAVGKAMGVNVAQLVESEGLSDAVNSSVRENVRLIRTIPAQYLDRIERIVLQETVKGRSATSIINQIREVHNVSENRARVIARDQSNKINGEITRQRQTALNIRAFRWRTVGDEAVRESHRLRNGKVYAWAPEFVGQRLADGTVLLDPTIDDIGYPGEDIQCRCIAEPIIELDRVALSAAA